MSPQYPELLAEKSRILEVAQAEEDSFLNTLRSGTVLFEEAATLTKKSGSKILPGKQAFVLHDTYGFPLDLTLEMAAEQGLSVDESEFRVLMSEQRSRAQADAKARKWGLADPKAYQEVAAKAGATEFLGHDELTASSLITGLLVGGESRPVARQLEEVEIVLRESPFYAESGGQLADTGFIELSNGAVAEVYDAQKPVPGLTVHRARVISGELNLGAEVVARVEVERRKQISQAHTATHLIHKAFREALGDTATQAGSENAPGRLRFDFPTPKAVGRALLSEVESVVNEKIDLDLLVTAKQMSLTEAKAMGAMALFGEKYGDVVRVVSVGDWSHELCGGTHVAKASEIGVVSLLSEQSIGAGVRRVEALVGTRAFRQYAQDRLLVEELTQILGKPAPEIAEQVKHLIEKAKVAEKHLAKARTADLTNRAIQLATNAVQIAGVGLVVFDEPDLDQNSLRELVTAIRGSSSQQTPLLIVGATSKGDQMSLVSAINKPGLTHGLSSVGVINEIASSLGGKGGGKPEMAQGNLTKSVHLPVLIKVITDWLVSIRTTK
jgi:alanyl-tRNA synthetase